MKKQTVSLLRRTVAILIVFVMALSAFALAPSNLYADVPPTVAADSITLVSPPSFTGHAVFDMLDLRGIALDVTFADGSTATWGYSDITPDMISWAGGRDLNYRADFIADATLNNVTRTLIITAGDASVEIPVAVQRYAFADGTLIVLHLASGNPVNGGVGEIRRNPATTGDAAVQHHVFSNITTPYVLGADGKFPAGYDINAVFEVVHNRGNQVGYGIRTLGRNTMLDTSWDNPGWASFVWADLGRSPNPDAIDNAFMWRIVRLPNGYHAIQYIDHDDRVPVWGVEEGFDGPRTLRAVAAQDVPFAGSPTDTRVAVPRVDLGNPNWWQDANIWFTVTTGGHPHDVEAYAISVGDVVALDGDTRAYSVFAPGHVEFNVPGFPVSDINFQWYRATSPAGPWVAIAGATAQMFTAMSVDVGYYLRVGVHPGGYNISEDAVFSNAFGPIEERPEFIMRSGDIESVRLIENGWLEIRWRNRMAFDASNHPANAINTRANYRITVNGVEVQIESGATNIQYYEFPIATPTTFMTSIRLENWEDLWDEWNINLNNPGFLWQQRYDFRNDPHNLFSYEYIAGLGTFWYYTGNPVPLDVQVQIVGNIPRFDGTYVNTNIVYDALFVPVYQWISSYMGVDLRMSGAMSREMAINNSIRSNIILAHSLAYDQQNLDGLITSSMVTNGFNTVLTGTGENAVFLPEFRHMGSFGAVPAGGFGATIHGPNNFINAAGGWMSVTTFLHEVGHGIDDFGITLLMSNPDITQEQRDFFGTIIRDLANIYMEILDQGWFAAATFNYMRSNRGEMFAGVTEIWFNARGQNDELPTGREAMEVYHPELHEVFGRFLFTDPLPPVPEWNAPTPSALREERSERRFVPNRGSDHDFTTTRYQFGSMWAVDPTEWSQAGVIGQFADGVDFSGQYFKLINMLDSHVITDSGRDDNIATWWDWEDSLWGGNFDGLSWIVTPVEIDGRTFFNFTMKGSGGSISYTGPHDFRFGDGSHPTLDGVFQYGGQAGAYDTTVPGAGGNSMGVAPGATAGSPVISMQHNLNDPYQLWYLVSHMGRYVQIANLGASMGGTSLILSTENGVTPSNGTPLVLVEWSMAPEIGAIWRVLQMRPVPHVRLPVQTANWSDLILRDFVHAVTPTDFYDVKMEQIWLDAECDRTIWIQWQDDVDATIAANVGNFIVSIGTEHFELVQEGSTSSGNTTRLMLAEPASEAIIEGRGSRIQFTGEMYGASGLPVNNMLSFSFRREAVVGVVAIADIATIADVATRAMFVEALAELAGVDTDALLATPSIFNDVAAGALYNGAVNWAVVNDIVIGIGGGNFAPSQPITREAAAMMLYNFALFAGIEVLQQAATFADADAVSDWAIDAVNAMQAVIGLIGGNFAPQGTMTGAEVAEIIEAFAQLMQ